jgi:hypothetical protein
MKKTLLLFSFVFLAICGFAQSVSFGVRGGVTLADQHIKKGIPYYQFNTSPITTFSFGGFADIRKGAFSLQPGIFFSGQGGETKGRYAPQIEDQSSYSLSDLKSKLWCAEAPVDVIYHLPVPFINIYVGAGPYVAMGLTGSGSGIQSNVYPDNPAQNSRLNFSQKVSFGSDGYRLFQFGANAIAGVQFKNHWLINIGYDLGLTSINHDNPGYANIKNDQFTVSVGYGFK